MAPDFKAENDAKVKKKNELEKKDKKGIAIIGEGTCAKVGYGRCTLSHGHLMAQSSLFELDPTSISLCKKLFPLNN